MRNRALLVTFARAGGLLAALTMAAACTHASANLMVDAPKMLPYQAPDIDEITGIDSEDEDEAQAQPTPAAQPPR